LYQVCMETHWCYPLGCDVGVSEGEVVVLGIYHTEVLGHLSARVLELCLLQVWLQSTAGTYNHVRSSVFPCLQEPGVKLDGPESWEMVRFWLGLWSSCRGLKEAVVDSPPALPWYAVRLRS
jgi:hypothetical protein